jgi:hypothetical protein
LSADASIVVLTMGALAAQDTPGEGGSFTEKMKKWQEKILGRLPPQLAAILVGEERQES